MINWSNKICPEKACFSFQLVNITILFYNLSFEKKQGILEQLSTSSSHCSHIFLHRKKKNIYIHIFDRKFAQLLS